MIDVGSSSEAAITRTPDFGAWKSRGPRPSALLELHRNSLLNVLVLGGTSDSRSRVARAFHERSPLRSGPFVPVDASRDEATVRDALLDWLQFGGGTASNRLRASERGTLFMDRVESLSLATQRLLLGLVSVHGGPAEWRGRLIVGSAADLASEARSGRFQPALFDVLDKVRIELSPPMKVICV